MMPNLTTPVLAPQAPFKLDFASGIVSLGSCFADEIGRRLQESNFHIEVNPFGALYNPASIASALHRLIEDRPIEKDDLVKHEGLWHSWHHHGSFSHTTPGATLTACNSRIHHAHTALKEANLLMITFGTAWIFEHEGAVVANCHKLPPQLFTRRRMTVEEIVALWQPLLQELNAYYPHLNIMFSVSPIRHMADGAHGNQLSKGTLLLAADSVTDGERVVYFPAYEILMDELRDYRFYAEDMVHPSAQAVDYIWERFCDFVLADGERQTLLDNIKACRRSRHRPMER